MENQTTTTIQHEVSPIPVTTEQSTLPQIPAITPPPPTPPTSTKPRSKAILITVFIFVLILLGTISIFVYQKFIVKPKVSPTPTPTATADPTANWKTYVNNKFGFSVQYPNSATTTTRHADPFPVAIQIQDLKPRTGGGGGPEVVGWIFIISEPQLNNNNEPLKQWAKGKGILSDQLVSQGNQTQATDTTIGGHSAIFWRSTGGDADLLQYLIKDNNSVILITINPATGFESIIDRALSSFRFLSKISNELTGTVSGKLCYPSDFLPEGEIVAKDIKTEKIYAQDYEGSTPGNSLTYSFRLPVGTYHLRYQAHASGNNPELFVSGYYTYCSLNPTGEACTSQDNNRIQLPVNVIANQETENINLCDFYYNPSQMTSLDNSF